ncbi:MAG TPA: RES family NAD+ phosphorylase [Blastocatellia bacterium]|nr:RES family NAD+ phosphorylase [Blastocatellia bacterium]
MELWRLCSARHQAVAFTGLGASLAGGRWNERGVTVVYTAGSLALAALECLVHFSAQTLPDDYVSIVAVAPAGVSLETIDPATLPSGWAEEDPPQTTRTLGTGWVRAQRSVLLKVPSAIIPTEFNYLINPQHPDFARIRIGQAVPFRFDPRLKQ